MGIKLYIDPCTVNCHKVLSALDHMRLPHETEFVSFFAGDHKKPEYTKINPCATLPAMIDGEYILTESNAILQYAADTAGSEGEKLYPKDARKRAKINQWLLWETSALFPSCYVFLIENVAKPNLMSAEPDSSALEPQLTRFDQLGGVLEGQLAKTKFLAGDELSIADFAVMAPLHLHGPAKLPLDKFPHLKRWIDEMEKLPAWSKHQGEVDKGLGVKKYVNSTLNYTKDVSPRLTELYFYEDEKAQTIHEPGDDNRAVAIHNGWERWEDFHEDKHGFSVHDFSSTYSSNQWENDNLVREQFYPEIVSFLKKAVGASRVLVFDHTIRTKNNAAKKLTQEANTTQRAPVSLVHCDYTAESGPVRVRQLLPDEAEDLLSRRVAFLNVWKPLAKVEEMPLGMCDVLSSPPEDFFKLFLRYRDRTGENYVMKYSDKHKWWYFPDMTADKCILLKTYDSDTHRAQFVGHSAFEDPTSRKDAPHRESIEVRTICFF